jgi:hypothetical protein
MGSGEVKRDEPKYRVSIDFGKTWVALSPYKSTY